MSSSPRPILKQRSTSSTHTSPSPPSHHAVHFPPSPSLAITFAAHSPSTYNRSPIVVSPNSCALPERGCPGRTYTLDDPVPSTSSPRRGHPYGGRLLHPRALSYSINNDDTALGSESDRLNACVYPALPPLIPDLSSESEESDSFPCPPSSSYQLVGASSTYHHGLTIHDKYSLQSNHDVATALSFLPYGSSSQSHSSHPDYDEEPQTPRPKRRRNRERRHDSSRDPDRIRSCGVPETFSPSSKSGKSTIPNAYKSLSICNAFSSFSIEDDGCLSGF